VPRRRSRTAGRSFAPARHRRGTSERDLLTRLQSATSRGRYQYWESAAGAQRTDPWRGIGPGTFELWWARNGTTQGFVRDAHSLYAESLGNWVWSVSLSSPACC
jgi:O-antigen ligase